MVLNLKCLLSVLIPSRKHPTKHLQGITLVGHKFPLQQRQVLQGMSLEGTWLQRPGRREDGLVGCFLGCSWVDSLGFVRQIFPCFDDFLVEFLLKKHEEEGNSTGKVIGKSPPP